MRQDYYVYILFDFQGIPRYVGKGCGNRWLNHEHKIDPINHRKNKFIKHTKLILKEVPKIKVCENLLESDAFATEVVLIRTIGRYPVGPLVNMTDGGEGITMSADICAKISKTLSGRKRPVEIGRKVSAKLKGRPQTAEQLLPRLNAIKEHFSIPENREPRAEFLRTNPKIIEARFRPRSEELKQRISVSVNEYYNDEIVLAEHIQKIKDGMTPEIKARMAQNMKGKIPWNKGKKCPEVSNTFWVTDGTIRRRLPIGSVVPEGFYLGKTTKPNEPLR